MIRKFLSHLPNPLAKAGDANRPGGELAISSKVKPRSIDSKFPSANSSPGHAGIPAERRDPNTLPNFWTVSSHGTMENLCDVVELASLVRPKRSVVTQHGHHFKLLETDSPTSCDHCQDVALSQVHKCVLCSAVCHTVCSEQLVAACTKRQPQQNDSADLSPYDAFETARDIEEQFVYTPRLRDCAADGSALTFPRRSQRHSADSGAAAGSSDSLLSGQNSLLHSAGDDDDDNDYYSTASQELQSASTRTSLLSPEVAYTVSSLDRHFNAAAGITVIEAQPDLHSPNEVTVQQNQLLGQEQHQQDEFHRWTIEKLQAHLFLLNEQLPGQEFCVLPPPKSQPQLRKFKGSLRVHVNLLRPIRMDEPSSSFFLPRGNACLLHDVSSQHSAEDVISMLLNKHKIRDPAHKFALFEHEIQGDRTVQVRKLQRQERPLAMMLLWTSLSAQQMRDAFQRKKFIMQENESSTVDWGAFTEPELKNFLLILELEEKQHREAIKMKFQIKRQQLVQQQQQLTGESEA